MTSIAKEEDSNHMKNRIRVTIDRNLCEGCGECVDGCPVDVFEIKDKKAIVVEMSLCGDCQYCESVCPTDAVKVECIEEQSN
jgi:NAD-dependent dihydropyrimidine dehydrogenase PreA subunit